MTEIIVGTAGHIDHGKTSLVKALTGIDADRLPEEKKRGITIDIGFAEMNVGEAHFGFVDVPGHERFVKNMLAGASGIHLVLLVVAADEGVMPQTREHFDICRLLGIERGLIALTRSDLVDADTLELAKLDVAELVASSFLEAAPVIAVSSKTSEGVDELRDALVAQGGLSARTETDRVALLPIDRSFTMKGFGSVVTGTLASGAINEGDELELLPAGTKVRVRGLHSHGKAASHVESGRRVAVNLSGIDHTEIERGMVLAEPNILRPTQVIDGEVELLAGAPRPMRSRQRVRVHLGTAEVLARIQVLNASGEIAQGGRGFTQLRLESPVVAVPGDRFIVRSYSPQTTIAGGVVLDNAPLRHRRRDQASVCRLLGEIQSALDDPSQMVGLLIARAGNDGASVEELQARTGLKKDVVERAARHHVDKGAAARLRDRYVDSSAMEEMLNAVAAELIAFHKREPLAKGMSRELLRERIFAFRPAEVSEGVLAVAASNGTVAIDKDTVRLASHSSELSPDEAAVRDKLLAIYADAALEVPKLEDALSSAIAGTRASVTDARKLLVRCVDAGDIVKVTDEFYFSVAVIDKLKAKLKSHAAAGDRLIDVAKFKELARVSRKYAIPLLEYFDRERVTVRVGDKRQIL